MNKKFYEEVSKLFNEDIGDLFYEIDNNNLDSAKEIVNYFRKIIK